MAQQDGEQPELLLENQGLQTGTMMLMETRPLQPFKTSEEYLYAMKEDLTEWLHILYNLGQDVEYFMEKLETGVILCQHANNVRRAAKEYKERHPNRKRLFTLYDIPDYPVSYKADARPGTFIARDNVHNFITWCRKLEIHECLLFESDDLVLRKNEKSVILCLLEVARRGARFGMAAPLLVLFEKEIDRDIAKENKRRSSTLPENGNLSTAVSVSVSTSTDAVTNDTTVGGDSSAMVTVVSSAALASTGVGDAPAMIDDEDDDDSSSIADSYGSASQIITNDLKSLDEMVRELVERCTCPRQFPMIRVAEGKYRIGDTKVLIYVRILRSHVMVRVGGGWDTLEHYLDKHDPCRCRQGHRGTLSSNVVLKRSVKDGSLNPASVQYERSESPGFVKKTQGANGTGQSAGLLTTPSTLRGRGVSPGRRSRVDALSTQDQIRRSSSPARPSTTNSNSKPRQLQPPTSGNIRDPSPLRKREVVTITPSQHIDSTPTTTKHSQRLDAAVQEKASAQKISNVGSSNGSHELDTSALMAEIRDASFNDSGVLKRNGYEGCEEEERPASRMTQGSSSECSSVFSASAAIGAVDSDDAPLAVTPTVRISPTVSDEKGHESNHKLRSMSMSSTGSGGSNVSGHGLRKKSRIPVLLMDRQARSASTSTPFPSHQTASDASTKGRIFANGHTNKTTPRSRRSSIDNSSFIMDELPPKSRFDRPFENLSNTLPTRLSRNGKKSVGGSSSRSNSRNRNEYTPKGSPLLPRANRKFATASPVTPNSTPNNQPAKHSTVPDHLKEILQRVGDEDPIAGDDQAVLQKLKEIVTHYEARVQQKIMLQQQQEQAAAQLADLDSADNGFSYNASTVLGSSDSNGPQESPVHDGRLEPTVDENTANVIIADNASIASDQDRHEPSPPESYTEKWLLDNHRHLHHLDVDDPARRKSSSAVQALVREPPGAEAFP